MRRYAYAEPVAVFVLLMVYIWALRHRHPLCWIAIIAIVLASHRFHRESAKTLGFARKNFRECAERFAPALIFVTLAMLGFGLLAQSTRPVTFADALFVWTGYVPWGTFQQYALNGYFANRLGAFLPSRKAALLAAALFSGAHTPNWFLMGVTLLAGYCSARIYHRYKNLYFLGIAHGTLGVLLYLVVPDSISHHMAVGPGWFHH
jgi:hypothetical protein